MKKTFFVFVAMALTLSMAAFSVYAAEAEGASVQISCTHSGGRALRTVYGSLELINSSIHGRPAVDIIYCRFCGETISTSEPYYDNKELHTFASEKYMGSNHSGNYTEHYYTYRKACTVCGGAVERTGKTGCTANRCIEPQ